MAYKKLMIYDKDELEKALTKQRGKYDKKFELWNAKQAGLEEQRRALRLDYRQAKVLDKNRKRAPNKTDYYD